MGLPVQYIHGMTSCSEWTGVPMSVLLKEVGVKSNGTWMVNEGGDACNFSHTLPTAKAMEDCILAYAQNGDPIREEQGFPIRIIVPGWEAPFSVKYLKNIKIVDQPYHAWNECDEPLRRQTRSRRQVALVSFRVRAEIRDHASVRRYRNAAQAMCRSRASPGPAAARSPRPKSRSTAARIGAKRSFRIRSTRRRTRASISTGSGTDKRRRSCRGPRTRRVRFS